MRRKISWYVKGAYFPCRGCKFLHNDQVCPSGSQHMTWIINVRDHNPTCMTTGKDTRTIIAKSNRNTHMTWKDDPIYNRASTSKPPPPEGSQIPNASLTEINPSTLDISKTKDNAGSAHRSRPCDGISGISLDAETSLCTDGFTEGSMP